MGKKILLIGLVVLVLWLGIASVFLWFRFRNSAEKAIPIPSQSVGEQVSPAVSKQVDTTVWAKGLMKKYSYTKGSYSGVISSGADGVVWVIGRRYYDKVFSAKYYVGVTVGKDNFVSKIADNVTYSYQVGDDLEKGIYVATSSADIKGGDYVAVRTTFADNFGLALEVRKLEPGERK